MISPITERRMAENEVVFREYNLKVQKGFEELKRLAKEDHQEDLLIDDDMPLHFYCECSDINCRERILIKPSIYKRIHKNKKRFIVLKGHESQVIEKIVDKQKNYFLVEKFVTTPSMLQAS